MVVEEDASIVEGVRELRIRSSRGMSRDHIFVNEHQHQSVLKLLRSGKFWKKGTFRVFEGKQNLELSSLFLFFSLYSSLVEEDKCDDFTTFMSSSSNIT